MKLKGFLGTAGGAVLAVGLVTASPADAARSSSASVANDTLTVTGSSRADQIAVRLSPVAPGIVDVDFGADGTAEHSFDRATFSSIVVRGGSNDDVIRIDQSNGSFADEATTLDGGSGGDTLIGGDGNELFDGGSGADDMDGNRGNDTANLGSGSDTFTWDPGDGSDVVDGRAGTDTLVFNGAGAPERMSLSANGRKAVFLRDLANIRMDLDRVERLDLRALGGADTITVDDMTRTDVETADLNLSAPQGGGDGSIDTVVVNGTARADDIRVETDDAGAGVTVTGLPAETDITGNEPTDVLQVNALGGNDDVAVDDAVAALIQVAIDLGTGQS